jgi:dTDP-4-amino-4,6-dideoxygalactose transaminase
MIPLAKPQICSEEIAAVENVLKSGNLLQGEQCGLFERELAKYLGVSHAVVVSSGTAALHLSLMALGVGAGDAVIVPDFTFLTTANVVEMLGARTIPVDVDPLTYNITPSGIEDALKQWNGVEKIRVVIPVHQFGCPADMTAIIRAAQQNGLFVIEDAACAIGGLHNGKKIGSFGDCACFSFHPRKIITTGEGGAIATNNTKFSAKLRRLRNHGLESTEYGLDVISPGLNYRMTDFQAALGRIQLCKLDGFIKERKGLFKIYQHFLGSSQIDLPKDVHGHTWQTCMVVLPEHIDRNGMIGDLKNRGVETNLGSYAVHALEYYRQKYRACTVRD